MRRVGRGELGHDRSDHVGNDRNRGAGDGRLSEASWATYQAARAKAQAVNAAATKTFQTCADLDFTSVSSDQIKACLGDSTSAVVTEGQKFMDTLAGFESEASGDCATALTRSPGT